MADSYFNWKKENFAALRATMQKIDTTEFGSIAIQMLAQILRSTLTKRDLPQRIIEELNLIKGMW